jgi:hypothetical protein
MSRDYKKEYAEYHSKPEQKKNRAKRNKANRNSDCGPGQEVDHKVPLSEGGSNSPSNWRVVSKKTNRKKGSKKMSNLNRLRVSIQNKTAAAEFDAYKYWSSLTPEQRQAMGDSVNSSMLGVTKEMNTEMEPLSKELQEYISPYQERIKAVTDRYTPRLQEALLKGYEEAGASAEYLDYIKNQKPNFTYMGKIASADDNFNTSSLEDFMSSARR